MNGNIERLQDELNRLNSREAHNAILVDKNLSEAGKQKQIDALNEQLRLDTMALKKTLRYAVVNSAMEGDKSLRLKKLLQKEYSEFDYNRLAYEAKAVEGALALAGGDWTQISEGLTEAQASGDKHKIKAWRDIAPALLPKETKPDKFGLEVNYDNEEKQAFIDALAGAELSTLSPEQARYENKRNEAKGDLAQLRKLAGGIDGLYSVEGQTPTRHAAHIFAGVAPNAENEMLAGVAGGETSEQYVHRTQAEIEAKRRPIEEHAREKMGVEIDWSRQADPE